MSFSSQIKNELCSKGMGNKCCMRAELAAFILFSVREDKEFRILTENMEVAKRIITLVKSIYDISASVFVDTKNIGEAHMYSVTVTDSDFEAILKDLCIVRQDGTREFRIYNGMVKNECCTKAFIKGVYLACGSMTDPEKEYHLEFVTRRMRLAGDLEVLLKKFSLKPKTVLRKSRYVVYFKSGDAIADVLTVMGAVNSLMELETTQVYKDIKNNVNRKNNCDTANLQKTVDASVKQRRAIEKIIEGEKLSSLPKGLQELAQLRLDNPDASLTELGKMMPENLSKSAVNHKLRKLMEIAENM